MWILQAFTGRGGGAGVPLCVASGLSWLGQLGWLGRLGTLDQPLKTKAVTNYIFPEVTTTTVTMTLDVCATTGLRMATV